MFGLGSIIPAAAGAVAALALGILYNAAIENPRVRRDERALVQEEARDRALDLIQKRGRDNEEISKLDMAALCRELGGSWVPVDNRCD